MGLWIESLPQLKSLADLLSGQAELVVAVSSSDLATPEQKKQINDDAVKLSAMVMGQLELYDLGTKEKEQRAGDHGWKCLRCEWEQFDEFPEPPFTPKPCGCCWDFQCPKCGGAVEHMDRDKTKEG